MVTVKINVLHVVAIFKLHQKYFSSPEREFSSLLQDLASLALWSTILDSWDMLVMEGVTMEEEGDIMDQGCTACPSSPPLGLPPFPGVAVLLLSEV